MAAFNTSTDLIVITNADALSDANGSWSALGGGSSGLAAETDFYVEGSGSISKQVKAEYKGMVYECGASHPYRTTIVPRGDGVSTYEDMWDDTRSQMNLYIWLYSTTMQAMDTAYNGGMRVIVGPAGFSLGTDDRRFFVAGKDTYTYGGWELFCVDWSSTTTLYSVGSGQGFTYPTVEFGAALSNIASVRGVNFGIDDIRMGRYIQGTGGDGTDTPGTFADLIAAVSSPNPILYPTPAGANLLGKILIGEDQSPFPATEFESSGYTLYVPQINRRDLKLIKSTKNAGLEIIGDNTTVNLSGMTFRNEDPASQGFIDAGSGATSPTVLIEDSRFIGWGSIELNPNCTIRNCTFTHCGPITLNGGTIEDCTFVNSGSITGSLSKITGCSFTKKMGENVTDTLFNLRFNAGEAVNEASAPSWFWDRHVPTQQSDLTQDYFAFDYDYTYRDLPLGFKHTGPVTIICKFRLDLFNATPVEIASIKTDTTTDDFYIKKTASGTVEVEFNLFGAHYWETFTSSYQSAWHTHLLKMDPTTGNYEVWGPYSQLASGNATITLPTDEWILRLGGPNTISSLTDFRIENFVIIDGWHDDAFTQDDVFGVDVYRRGMYLAKPSERKKIGPAVISTLRPIYPSHVLDTTVGWGNTTVTSFTAATPTATAFDWTTGALEPSSPVYGAGLTRYSAVRGNYRVDHESTMFAFPTAVGETLMICWKGFYESDGATADHHVWSITEVDSEPFTGAFIYAALATTPTAIIDVKLGLPSGEQLLDIYYWRKDGLPFEFFVTITRLATSNWEYKTYVNGALISTLTDTVAPPAGPFKIDFGSVSSDVNSRIWMEDFEILQGASVPDPLEYRMGDWTDNTNASLVGNTFTGYGTNNPAIHFPAVTGTIDVALSGGAAPPYVTEGATVNFNSSSTLTLTGLVDNTEVRVYEAGTTNEIAGVENTSGGTFVTAVSVSSVDIVVHSLDELPQRLEGIDTTVDQNIPIQQFEDRQYYNDPLLFP